MHHQFSYLYMFWIHTEAIKSLGPLEYILNTPSHHRVHHGKIFSFVLSLNYQDILTHCVILKMEINTTSSLVQDMKIIYYFDWESNLRPWRTFFHIFRIIFLKNTFGIVNTFLLQFNYFNYYIELIISDC